MAYEFDFSSINHETLDVLWEGMTVYAQDHRAAVVVASSGAPSLR